MDYCSTAEEKPDSDSMGVEVEFSTFLRWRKVDKPYTHFFKKKKNESLKVLNARVASNLVSKIYMYKFV